MKSERSDCRLSGRAESRWGGALAVCACTVILGAGVVSVAADSDEQTMVVLAAGSSTVAALGAVARAALSRAGLDARVAPPPPECRQGENLDRIVGACLNATLRALVQGSAHVALVEVGSHVPPSLMLRDAGLEDLGDVVPPQRRACLAIGGDAHSLLDLGRTDCASSYHLDDSVLRNATRALAVCPASNISQVVLPAALETATLLLHDDEDLLVLTHVVCEWKLKARIATLGPWLASVLTQLRPEQSAIFCSRDPMAFNLAALKSRFLGPPPCVTEECPFDPMRFVKLVNVRELAHSPTAFRVIARLALNETELRELKGKVRTAGVEGGARQFMQGRPAWSRPRAEVRVAVMVPTGTHRDILSVRTLQAAAELAELDMQAGTGRLGDNESSVVFKAELMNGGCNTAAVFDYFTGALGTEYGALSAVFGPVCGATFADVARQSPSLALPVLAYTRQAPPSGTSARLTILAAGDARDEMDAWAAIFMQFGWRRLAVLSELGTRPALDTMRLSADIVVHVELTGDGEEVNSVLITEWAERAFKANARVLLVSAEDARVVRSALCAGGRAGLTPRDGAVWLLPGTLDRGWLQAVPLCEQLELENFADGHLSLVPEWVADWQSDNESQPWVTRWREVCLGRAASTTADECLHPPAFAALLYDTLHLWAAALRRLLSARPADLDDLHRRRVIQKLVADATSAPFVGLTGPIEWVAAGEAQARSSALILMQRWASKERRVGKWVARQLTLVESELTWRTTDGSVPDDGGTVTLVLVTAVCMLAGTAWQCKRRAESEYRARLAELGLRTLNLKPGGLDRWEVPRERVVINRKLGTGAFGTVYGGHALLAEGRGWTPVAVKTLKVGATTEDKLDFLSEAETMKRFEHKNIVRLLGVVTKSEPVCTVMEFMLFGDLKTFLLARRHLAGSEEVSAARLTGMALDVARALSYLAQLRYVHRDVAARNCLVSATRAVKLADFGMTRLVFENDYYRFSRKGLLPVRWMAPESLALGVFSTSSDVWSFGVLLYEMVTFGALPYQGLSNSEVLGRVKAGHTLDMPSGIKPQLEGLIKSCWVREPRARPAAADVAAFLAESTRLLAPCPESPPVALTLDIDAALTGACWTSWAAPPSASTDTTYLSTEGHRDTDAFLP